MLVVWQRVRHLRNQDPDGSIAADSRARSFLDCDDGWKSGVLCQGCREDCADRGPKPGATPTVPSVIRTYRVASSSISFRK